MYHLTSFVVLACTNIIIIFCAAQCDVIKDVDPKYVRNLFTSAEIKPKKIIKRLRGRMGLYPKRKPTEQQPVNQQPSPLKRFRRSRENDHRWWLVDDDGANKADDLDTAFGTTSASGTSYGGDASTRADDSVYVTMMEPSKQITVDDDTGDVDSVNIATVPPKRIRFSTDTEPSVSGLIPGVNASKAVSTSSGSAKPDSHSDKTAVSKADEFDPFKGLAANQLADIMKPDDDLLNFVATAKSHDLDAKFAVASTSRQTAFNVPAQAKPALYDSIRNNNNQNKYLTKAWAVPGPSQHHSKAAADPPPAFHAPAHDPYALPPPRLLSHDAGARQVPAAPAWAAPALQPRPGDPSPPPVNRQRGFSRTPTPPQLRTPSPPPPVEAAAVIDPPAAPEPEQPVDPVAVDCNEIVSVSVHCITYTY